MAELREILDGIEQDFNSSAAGRTIVLSLTAPDEEREHIDVTFFRREDADMEDGTVAAAIGQAQSPEDDIEENVMSRVRKATGIEARMCP